MRFRSLNLKAYGHFTDRTIEFGKRIGQVDIVLGLNEAGKSTALRAIEGFCYGIEEKTGDNYVHPYDRLRVGADIEMGDGTQLTIFRKKGRKNTVRGAGDEILPDDLLENCLCGIGQAGFRALFCLDFERIARGSESLLEEGGEVGKLLFEARSDLSLRPVLKALSDRSEELFKGNPRSNAIIDGALRKHDELRKAAKRSDVPQYKERERQFEALEQQAAELRSKIANLRRAETRWDRFNSALEQISARTTILREVQDLGVVVELHDNFSEMRMNAQVRLATGRARTDNSKREAQRIEREINEAEVDEVVLAWQEEIVDLYEQIGKIWQMARDLPLEQAKAEVKTEEARLTLHRFWPTPASPPPLAVVTDRERKKIREVDRRGTQLRTSFEEIQDRVEQSKKRIRGFERDLESLPEATVAESLRHLVSIAKGLGDIDTQVSLAEAYLEEAGVEAELLSRRLQLPEVTLDRLVRLPVPSATTIRLHQETLRSRRDSLNIQEDNVAAAHQRGEVATRERQALVLAGAVPTEADLLSVRAIRDDTWRLIVSNYIDLDFPQEVSLHEPAHELRTLFEDKIDAADLTADRLRREAQRAARLAEIDAEAQSAAIALENAGWARTDAVQMLENATRVWEEIWDGVDIPIRSPGEMLEWREGFTLLCELESKIRTSRIKHDSVTRSRILARSELVTALGVEPAGNTLASVLMTSERLLEESDAHRGARSASTALLVEERNRLSESEEGGSNLEEDLKQWLNDWAIAIAPLHLSRDSDRVDVDGALDALDKATALFAEVTIAEKRVAGMQRDIDDFEGRVGRIHEAIGSGSPLTLHVAVARATFQRLEAARLISERVSGLQANLIRVEGEGRLAEDEVREATLILNGLCAIARCEKEDDLEEVERRYAKRNDLESRLQSVESGIRALSGGLPLDEFCAEVSLTDADTIAEELRLTAEDLTHLESRLQDVDQKIGEARQSLLDAESVGILLNTRAEAEAELAKACFSVRPYLIYNLAETLVAAQLEEFRRANQGPILAKAGQVFSILTDGSFTDLTSDLDDKDKPILIAIRSSGERVGVEGLSSATRVGLYLALRIACLYHHANARECVPFFADDILLDFDDARARCAFTVLGELAQRTQVILFTHHAHLAAIGEEVLGEAVSTAHLSR